MKFYGKDKKEYNTYIESILKKSFHKDDYEFIDINADEKEYDTDHEFIIKIDPKDNIVTINRDDGKLMISQCVMSTYMEVLNTCKDDNEIIKNIIHIFEAMLTYDNDYIDDASYSCQ